MYCTEHRHGPEMRKKLKEINRCDVCLVTADNHSSECQKANFPCKTCYSRDHETITCDGNTHPGSWIINKNDKMKLHQRLYQCFNVEQD